MNVITTVNDRRFSLNDIQYLKNYVTQLHGNNVTVFNCYESKDVLIEQTHYSQFTVNGSAYSSAKALQTALLDVLYSRGTLGGDGSSVNLLQNNIGIVKDIGFFEKVDDIYAAVVNLVNLYYALPVADYNSPIILVLQKVVRPNWAPITGPYNGTLSPVAKYGFLFLGGKGNWGLNATPITASMLYALPPENLVTNDIERNPDTVIVNYGALTNQTVSQWLNSSSPAVVLQPQNEGYTLFKGAVNGFTQSYLWVGNEGTYGAGNLQSTNDDFQELSNEAPSIASIHKPVKIITQSTLGFVNGIYTIQAEDKDKWLSFDISSDFTITAPTFPVNTLLEGESVGNGLATFATLAGISLRYAASELPKTAEKNSVFGLKYRAATEIFLYGRLQLL